MSDLTVCLVQLGMWKRMGKASLSSSTSTWNELEVHSSLVSLALKLAAMTRGIYLGLACDFQAGWMHTGAKTYCGRAELKILDSQASPLGALT